VPFGIVGVERIGLVMNIGKGSVAIVVVTGVCLRQNTLRVSVRVGLVALFSGATVSMPTKSHVLKCNTNLKNCQTKYLTTSSL
jgi:hypothetical protein